MVQQTSTQHAVATFAPFPVRAVMGADGGNSHKRALTLAVSGPQVAAAAIDSWEDEQRLLWLLRKASTTASSCYHQKWRKKRSATNKAVVIEDCRIVARIIIAPFRRHKRRVIYQGCRVIATSKSL
jgi:hypothetical protein